MYRFLLRVQHPHQLRAGGEILVDLRMDFPPGVIGRNNLDREVRSTHNPRAAASAFLNLREDSKLCDEPCENM